MKFFKPAASAFTATPASSTGSAARSDGGGAILVDATAGGADVEPGGAWRIGKGQNGGKTAGNAASRGTASGPANGDCDPSARARQKRAEQRSEIKALLSKLRPGDDRRGVLENRLVVIECGEDRSDSGPALQVDVKPFGAEITLDGNFVGKTPMLLDKLTPGRHKLQLAHPDHEPVEVEVEIHAEGRTTVTAELLRTSKAVVSDYRARQTQWENDFRSRMLYGGATACAGLSCAGLSSAGAYYFFQNLDLGNTVIFGTLGIIGLGYAGYSVSGLFNGPPAPERKADDDGELVIEPPVGKGQVVRVPLKRKEPVIFTN